MKIRPVKNILALTSMLLMGQLFLISCANVRKTEYFADQQDSDIVAKSIVPLNYIQANDIISITVTSLNPTATAIFNAPASAYVTSTTSSGNSLQSPGYLVGTDGEIQFPVLGNFKVAGLTTNQLRIELTRQLVEKKLLVEPVVTIRQLNFKVSVLGEVGHPTVINVPSEKISLLEALGLAGDITIYGRKDNVMVIREQNGHKTIRRIDLNSKELFASPYYYLKSNDVVYVEANKAKVASSGRGAQSVPIILSALSVVAILIEIVTRK
jgi:polysaccharide export outer membrane protein